MTSIGDLNHVLNQNSATSGVGDFGTGDYYVCYSVTNGIAKYRKHNDTTTNHDIKYDPSTGWSDAGGQEPDRFCTSATNNTIITPPVTATTLYMWTGTQFNLGLDTGYVASGGAGTLSTADTASFAGTTLQQIQWAIKHGSSPVANTNYYLFNETPGGNALDTINLGSNPQAGATQTETYINPSGADFTGKWYIGYGQNSTRVNLKVYDFSSRKVFCNFW